MLFFQCFSMSSSLSWALSAAGAEARPVGTPQPAGSKVRLGGERPLHAVGLGRKDSFNA